MAAPSAFSRLPGGPVAGNRDFYSSIIRAFNPSAIGGSQFGGLGSAMSDSDLEGLYNKHVPEDLRRYFADIPTGEATFGPNDRVMATNPLTGRPEGMSEWQYFDNGELGGGRGVGIPTSLAEKYQSQLGGVGTIGWAQKPVESSDFFGSRVMPILASLPWAGAFAFPGGIPGLGAAEYPLIGEAAGATLPTAGATGSGLTAPANAGEIMGTGGSDLAFNGAGLTSQALASGAGMAGQGAGIGSAAGRVGSLGALDFASMNFSPAAMQALGVNTIPTIAADSGLRFGSSSLASGSENVGLRVPQAATAPAGTLSAVKTLPSAQGGTSFVDSLISQMKNNALQLGLMGASTLMSLGKKSELPNKQQIQGLGEDAQAVARQLIAQYQSGTLSPGQQASLNQMAQNTKNQIRNYFASIGQGDSTAAVQSMAQVDQAVEAMKQEMLDNALAQGLQAIGIAQGPLNTIAQYELAQDQQLKQAFGNFATGVGTLFGRQAGSPQQQPQTNTAAPTISSARA